MGRKPKESKLKDEQKALRDTKKAQIDANYTFMRITRDTMEHVNALKYKFHYKTVNEVLVNHLSNRVQK